MRNLNFELYKIKREIEIQGEKYNISREEIDEYGTPTGENNIIVENVKGLFHTSKGYITKNISDGTKVHTKGQPMLLVNYEDSLLMQNEDFIVIGENKYKIVEKNNIQMYNMICDISLELVVNDTN